MPTISIFYGIVVQMYWRDHPPPHLHAYYQGYEGLFAIKTGELIEDAKPPGPRRILRVWVARHHAELIENWRRGRIREPLQAVQGADEE